MAQIDTYVARIRTYYPELRIEEAVLNEDGQSNDVLIVNDQFVFRFARYLGAVATLARETAILQAIKPYVTLQIPEPTYQHFDAAVVGEAFVGYPMIPGEALWEEDFEDIDDSAILDEMARQVGTFLRELHCVPVAAAIAVELPIGDQRDHWADMYARIQQKLFPLMRPDAREPVARHFDSFLNNPHVYEYTPVLRHGDFGFGNIIVDPETSAITGVVDFGSAGMGDPAVDFAGVAVSFGLPFLEHCALIYPEITATISRVHFYLGSFALQEALFGFENGDSEAFESGMADYV